MAVAVGDVGFIIKGGNNMNIFQVAAELQRTEKVRVRRGKKVVEKVSPSLLIRRAGMVVKDTAVATVIPAVKGKKVIRRRRTENMAVTLQMLGNNKLRRKELGKWCYECREELLKELQGYGVEFTSICMLSLVDLKERLAEAHKRVAKAWISQGIPSSKSSEGGGKITEGFRIVSSISCKAVDYEALAKKNMMAKNDKED